MLILDVKIVKKKILGINCMLAHEIWAIGADDIEEPNRK